MQELIDSQRQYQQLLRQILEEHRQQVDAMHQMIDNGRRPLLPCPRCDSGCVNSIGYVSQTSINSPINENCAQVSSNQSGAGATTAPQNQNQNLENNGGRPSLIFPQISVTQSCDNRLVKWLQGLGIDHFSIERIISEEYCLEDILFHVTRDDLRRLHLRYVRLCGRINNMADGMFVCFFL